MVADARTSQLVVVATEQEQAGVDALITQLDTATRQVLIETKLVELSSNPNTEKGVDWTSTLQAQNVAFGNGVLSGTSTTTTPGTTAPATTTPSGATIGSGGAAGSSTVNTLISSIGNGGLAASTASGLLPDTGFLTADGVKAVLSFLNESTEAQVVSTPRVVTLDNETATISVIDQIPHRQRLRRHGQHLWRFVHYLLQRRNHLQVTPRITANDYIWLKVVPEVSSFAEPAIRSLPEACNTTSGPFDVRHVETQVLIPNAHTLVMGGLVQDNPNALTPRFPSWATSRFWVSPFAVKTKACKRTIS